MAEREEEEEAAGLDPAQWQRLAPIEPGGAPLGRGAVARSGWPQRPLLVPSKQLLFSSRGSPPQGLWVPAWGQDPYFSPSPWLRLGPHKLGARRKDGWPRGDTPSPGDTPRGLMQQLQGWGTKVCTHGVPAGPGGAPQALCREVLMEKRG